MDKPSINNQEFAELLFPHITAVPADYEKRYPPRQLPSGAKVTRIAPSPTGFMHLGNLFGALIDERLAHQSGGVFYLRIEDTDLKRAVEGGVEAILTAFAPFGLRFDEGVTLEGQEGDYGPYYQRQRVEIYQCYVKELVRRGMAYPCFCTEEELAAMRQNQEAEKANPGYYGKWAVYRSLPIEQAASRVQAGAPYVMRLRSPGDPQRRVQCKDLVRGTLDMPENDQDVVLLKSDGIPTYHFAHVVDDHLMRTTHVVRAEEWLASLPIHLQLFEALGFEPPAYVHTAQLMKMDGGSKRKLSKRKDPELAISYYHEKGYPVACVLEYLMTVLNSNFEEWRIANPDAPLTAFPFTTEKMSVSGSLFDIDKLLDVSKNTIARMTAEEVAGQALAWAEEYDPELYALMERDRSRLTSIFQIGRGGDKPRKDIGIWSDVRGYLDFFYDELFTPAGQYPQNVSAQDAREILARYREIYDETDNNENWFNKIRALSAELGYAPKPKDYKKEPERYKGHVGDVSAVLRMAVTGRVNSPDMFEVMRILGKEKVLERVDNACKALHEMER